MAWTASSSSALCLCNKKYRQRLLRKRKRSEERRNVEEWRYQCGVIRGCSFVRMCLLVVFLMVLAFKTTTATTSSHYLSTSQKSPSSSKPINKRSSSPPRFLQPLADWYSSMMRPDLMKDWPKIQCRLEPTTTLKIRKTFRPLKTIVRLSARYNTQLGVWQFQSSWEDALIGGKFTLAGRKELQFTKSWSLTGGSALLDDFMVTRLRLRAAVDLQNYKAYVRVGVRTEPRSAAPNVITEGFTVVKRLPLDGPQGQCKLEIKANFALPEPEIEYSTETHRSLVGMGDIEVGIEELNLLLDY